MKNFATSAEKNAPSGPELAPGEVVVASFRPDLSQSLRFAESLVVATNQRLWFRDAEERGGELSRGVPIEVERREHAGVCEMFVRQAGQVLRFRYTLARAREARGGAH